MEMGNKEFPPQLFRVLIYKNNRIISGHFGCVYKGYLQTPGEKGEQIVAAKTLHRKNFL